MVVLGEDALGLLWLLGLVQQWICEDPTKLCFSSSVPQGWRAREEAGSLLRLPAAPPAAGPPRALTPGWPRECHLSNNHDLSPCLLAKAISGAKAWLSPRWSPHTAARVAVRRRGVKGQSAARGAERGMNALKGSSPANTSPGLSFALCKSTGCLPQTPPPAAQNLDLITPLPQQLSD